MNVNTFSGNPKTEWLPNGRDMMLLEDFSFADTERIWTAKKGAIINGASIPKFLWSEVGSPFVGLYRNASILHDYYCGLKHEPPDLVNRMFYQAMIASNVNPAKASLMYEAVSMFGPRWDEDGNDISTSDWSDDIDEDMMGG